MTNKEKQVLSLCCGALQDISEKCTDRKSGKQVREIQIKIEKLIKPNEISISFMKEIKDYLHLYLGCEYLISGKKCKLDAEALSHSYYHNHFNKICVILRLVRDITDVEVHSLEDAMWDNWQDPQLGDKESVLKIFINDSSSDRIGYEITVKATNWFRKNGFDVDGLIEAGLAIDKTQLVNNNIIKEVV